MSAPGGVQIIKKASAPAWLSAAQKAIKRPMLLIAPAVIAVVVYIFFIRETPAPPAQERPITGTGATYGAQEAQLGERQRELIDTHNDVSASETAEAMDAGQPAANVASLYTAPNDITAAPVEAPAAPPAYPQPLQPAGVRESRQAPRERQLARSTADYASRLYGRWASSSVAVTYQTQAPVTPEVTNEPTVLSDLLGIEIGRPVAATLVVGANSDAPGAIVAELQRPRLRMIGAAKRTAPDQLTVEFRLAVTPDGTVYQIEAQALDPETGSPALQGRVKRHILRNLFGSVSGTTLGYLGGFAAGVRSNPSSFFGLDPDLALRATAAQTLQATVPRPRDPTVTVDAGTPIQVLLTSPPRLGTRNLDNIARAVAPPSIPGAEVSPPEPVNVYTSEGLQEDLQ